MQSAMCDLLEEELERLGKGPFHLDFPDLMTALTQSTKEGDQACSHFVMERRWPKLPEMVRVEICCRLQWGVENEKAFHRRMVQQGFPMPPFVSPEGLCHLLIDQWKAGGSVEWLNGIAEPAPWKRVKKVGKAKKKAPMGFPIDYSKEIAFFHKELKAMGAGPFNAPFEQLIGGFSSASAGADEACRMFSQSLNWPELDERERVEICCRLCNAIDFCQTCNYKEEEETGTDETGSEFLESLLATLWQESNWYWYHKVLDPIREARGH